ncbi:MAG: phage tail tape measure protein [Pilosibacter sp.]|mgnify:CR=1 FL=1
MASANVLLSAGLDIEESLANLKKDIQTIQDRLNEAGIKITLPVDLDEKIVKSLKDIGNGKTTAESGKKIGDALATSLINQFNIKAKSAQRQIKDTCKQLYTVSVGELSSGQENPRFMQLFNELGEAVKSNANVLQSRMGIYDDFYNYFQNLSKIKIPSIVQTDLGKDWDSMRKVSAGKFVTDKSKSGTELDSIYQEMADKYKDIFSGTADPTEQFREIVNAVKAYRADIDRLEPVDPKKITGFEEDMWSDIITSIGQMREQIKAQMPQVTDEIEKNISNIKKSLMEVDASFDHTGIEQLTADVKQYFTALTGISDKDIKLQFFKDANEDVTSFNATLDRGQGILEKYSFTMNDLGQYVYTGGSLIDQSGKEFSEVSVKAAEYQKKLEALKSTYQSFLQGDSAANPFKALVDGIEFSNITDKGSLDQMIAKFNGATAQAKAFNAEISKKASFNAAEKLKQYLSELPAQIEYLETKFKGANFQIPDDVNKSFTSMRQCLQDINKTDGPEQKIKLYNQLTGELDKVTQKYKQLSLEQKNTAKDSALQSGKNLLGTNIDSWMNKNTAAAKVFADRLTDIKSKLSAADSADFNNLKHEFNEIQVEAKQMGLTGSKAAQEMKSQFDSMLSSVISVTAAMQTFRKMVGTAKDIDTAMYNIQVATGQAREDAKGLMETYNQMAQELGFTTTEVSSAGDDWLRSGKSISEANELIKDSLILARIGMIDTADATEDLMAIINGFRMNASDAVEIISRLGTIDRETASSAGGLAESLSRTASSAKEAGVSLDMLLGMLATIKDTALRLGDEEIGNAIKSIVARYTQIKVGKFVDYESGDDLSNVEKALGKVGVKIRENLTDYRDLGGVLSELASKYNKLNDVEKNSISTALFGSYQSNTGRILLSNWDKVEKLTKLSENSSTEALEKFDQYADTVEAHFNSMIAAYEKLTMQLADSEFLKGMADSGTTFLNVLSEIIDKLGVLSTAAGAITIGGALKGNNIGTVDNNGTDLTFLGKTADELERASAAGEKFGGIFNKSVKEPIVNAESIIGNYNELVKKQCVSQERINALTDDLDMRKYLSGLKGAEAGMTGYTVALNMGSAATLKLKVQTVALNVALNMGVVAAITAGITVLTKGIELGAEAIDNYVHRLENAKEVAEDAKESYDETASKFESLNDEMKTTQSRMDELEAKDHLTFVEQEELDKLKATSAELEQQIELYQALKNMQGDIARDKAVDYFGTETNTKRYDGWDSNSSLADYSTSKENPLERTEKDIEQYSTLLARQKELNDEIAKYKAEHVDDVFMSQDYNDKTSELSVIDKQLETLKTRLADSDTDFIKFKSSLNSITDKDMIEQVDKLVNEINALFNGGSSDSTDQFDKHWNDSSFTSAKRELSKMASAGTLTPETLESNEKYKQLLDTTGKTAQEVTDHIYALTEAEQQAGNTDISAPFTKSEMISEINGLSEGFEELDKIMASVVAKDKAFDFSLLDDKKFKDNFQDYTTEYNNFINTVTKNPKDINACQSAFDDLATAYIYNSNVMKGLSEDTADVAAQYLKLMGVSNSAEVIAAGLAKEHVDAALASKDLSNATYEEIEALANETEATDAGQRAFKIYAAQKLLAQDGFDVSGDITALANIVNSLGIATTAWVTYYRAKRELDAINASSTGNYYTDRNGNYLTEKNGKYYLDSGAEYSGQKINHIIDDGYKNRLQNQAARDNKKLFDDLTEQAKVTVKETGGNKTSNTGASNAKSSKDSEKDPTTFDWMERKLTILDKQTSTLQDKIDNLVGYKAKNQVTDTVLDLLGDKLTTLEKMSARYQEQLNSIDLPEEWIEKIQSGAYDIDSLDSDKDKKLIKKIQDYQTWYDKIQDCKDKIDETTKSIKEMNLSKLDNIIDQFDQTRDILSQIIDTEKDLLDLREQQGEKISANDYISLANKQYEATKQNIEEYNRLSAEMSKLNLERGSEEWKKYNDQLQDLKDNMIAAADAVESYKDAMTELVYKDLDDYKSKLDSLNGTISTMSGLIGDTNLVDDNGELTDRGLAQLALYAQQLSNAKHEAAEYDNAIQSLNDALRTGLITQDEYNSMLYEYKSAQESAVSSVKDARDSILSLVKDGIQAEIDAKKELIDQTKAELEAEQDLHDYQESIADQQKNITNLQRQIATLSDSTERKDIAQKLKLQSDLAEAQKKLYDTQYDHELDERKKALDDEYNTFEESKQKEMEELETDLDKQESAISKYLDKVKKDHSTAYDVLKQYGENYNLTATDDLTEPWESASSAADTCSDAIGNVTANIQYQINSLDFSSLYELVNLLNTIKGLGYGDGDATNSQWEDISGTGTWHKSTASGRWWYGADENNYASDGIYTIDGKQYGFNGKGQMVTGWRNDIGDDNVWRYFGSDGSMARSAWKKSKDGTWYYLDHNGDMATDMAVKAKDGNGYYYVDNDGKWDGTTLTTEDVNRLKYKIGYKNGTKNATPGYHPVFEDGTEIITLKDGTVLYPFKGGETVLDHEKTERFMNSLKTTMPRFTDGFKNSTLDNVKVKDVVQTINIDMPIGGVLDEAAARVLSKEFIPMVRKNGKYIAEAVTKDMRYEMKGK